MPQLNINTINVTELKMSSNVAPGTSPILYSAVKSRRHYPKTE